MSLCAAHRGWSFTAVLASCSLLGCSAVLGYESDYDDSRGRGDASAGAAGASGTGGAGGLGQAGRAGATSGQGGSASGQGGTASGQGGGTSGAGGGTAGEAGQGGALAGASGAGGAGGATNGTAGASQGGAGSGGAAGTSAGASGQAGSLSGGSAGVGQAGAAGASGGAGDGGSSAGTAGAGGVAGGTGGSGGAGGLPACVIPTAPGTACGDVLASKDNCGACGLSCGTQGECIGGRCVLDPVTKAPYARLVGYFGLPLAAQSSPNSDRLLYRTQVSVPNKDPVHALYDISLSDDAPLLKRLGTDEIKVGSATRPVTRWKSARFVPSTNFVIGVAAVARIPDQYPQDRVLVSLNRSTGEVLQTFQLSGDGGAWADTRPPVGGMVGAQETADVVALGQKRGVVWDFVEGPTGGAVLRGFPVPLTSTGVFDTVIEPRHAIAASIVSLNDAAYYLSQATMNAPFKLKTIKLETNATEASFGDSAVSFVHPTSMAIVPGALFVADAGGDPAAAVSPNGKLYRYDTSNTCTKSQPQPVVVAENLQRLIAIAADATHVYTLEVREVAGGIFENVLRRRFHDGTGQTALLVETRSNAFLSLATSDNPERAERLGKGFVLGQSYGKPILLFGLGSDPAEYREPTDYILGVPR